MNIASWRPSLPHFVVTAEPGVPTRDQSLPRPCGAWGQSGTNPLRRLAWGCGDLVCQAARPTTRIEVRKAPFDHAVYTCERPAWPVQMPPTELAMNQPVCSLDMPKPSQMKQSIGAPKRAHHCLSKLHSLSPTILIPILPWVGFRSVAPMV